jgi:UDP-N-acetyl-D-mannosaminuronic acid dehydrogenase
MQDFHSRQVVVIGGGGHVGLPLSMVLADKGHTVTALDLNPKVVDQINSSLMPFIEEGAESLLSKVNASSRFKASTDPRSIESAEIVIILLMDYYTNA